MASSLAIRMAAGHDAVEFAEGVLAGWTDLLLWNVSRECPKRTAGGVVDLS